MPVSTLTPTAGPAVAFISLRGAVQLPALQVEEITRPGMDGIAVRQLGQRGTPFEMIGVVDCDDTSAAEVTMARLAAMKGTIVTLYDDFGEGFGDVLVLEVARLAKQTLRAAVGGRSTSKGVLLSVRLVMVITE